MNINENVLYRNEDTMLIVHIENSILNKYDQQNERDLFRAKLDDFIDSEWEICETYQVKNRIYFFIVSI